MQKVDAAIGCACPNGHGLHVSEEVAPTAVEKRPAAHGRHALEVFSPFPPEYRPTSHIWQWLSLVAPETLLHVPGTQSKQASAAFSPPSSGAYVPLRQRAQPDSLLSAASIVPCLPRGQAEQVCEDVVAEKRPRAHGVHDA